MEQIELAKLDIHFFADPASGKVRVKRARARQAIIGIASDWLERVYVIYSWAGRLPASKFRDKIIDAYEQWKPRLFGIESNAMQSLFADLVRDEARRRIGAMRIVGVDQPTRIEKDFRIRMAIEPVIYDGRLFIPPKHDELLTELRGFPTARTKDLVDALASAISLMPKKARVQQKEDEIEQLAAYLRRSGMPPHLIEQRVQQVQAGGHTLH